MDEEIIEFCRNKTFLITGASGLIGTNFINLLLCFNKTFNCNTNIVAHVLNETEISNNIVLRTNKSSLSFVICDIRDFEFNGKIDYVIHTVGVTGGSKQHIDNPLKTIYVSLDGTRKMLDFCVAKKCSGFLFLSSLEIYGNTGFSSTDLCENNGGFLDPSNVRSSYSESKRMCETLCSSYYKEFALPAYVARLTASFGKYVSKKDNRVFAQFARALSSNSDIILKSDGSTVRNYCDAEDVARAFLYILMNGTAGCAYNVANPYTEISIRDLATKFISLYSTIDSSNKTRLVFEIEDTSKYGYNATMRIVLNANRLIGLGWIPKYSLDETILRLLGNYIEE